MRILEMAFDYRSLIMLRKYLIYKKETFLITSNINGPIQDNEESSKHTKGLNPRRNKSDWLLSRNGVKHAYSD